MADLNFTFKSVDGADGPDFVLDFTVEDASGHIEFDDQPELNAVIGLLQGIAASGQVPWMDDDDVAAKASDD